MVSRLRSTHPDYIRSLVAMAGAAMQVPRSAKPIEVTTGERYFPHGPWPKQRVFIDLPNREAMYGGAAGGGKSDALLMAALQYMHVPGYAALILRKTFADLSKPDALIPRSKEWLMGTDAKWNDNEHKWTFPSAATLSFGYLATDLDVYQYQSAAYQFIGFDELTQFSLFAYTYMFSRCRRPAGEVNPALNQVPLRVRSATNPGGVGHDWVKARFAIVLGEGTDPRRPFIPSKLEDNPALDREAYLESLAELDYVTRQQLENGDWDVDPLASVFKRAWFRRYEVLPAQVDAWLIYGDTAQSEDLTADYSVFGVWAMCGLDFYLVEVMRGQFNFGDLLYAIADLVAAYSQDADNLLPVVIEETTGSKPLIQTLKQMLRGVIADPQPQTNKVNRAKSQSHLVEAGNVYLPENEPWVSDFLGEVCSFPTSPHDDQVDMLSGSLRWLNTRMSMKDDLGSATRKINGSRIPEPVRPARVPSWMKRKGIKPEKRKPVIVGGRA